MQRILSISVTLTSVGFLAATVSLAISARAQTIVDEWATAKLPAPPQLKPAKIAVPKETALLVMDFTNQTCSKERRPRCTASVPKVAKLVNDARAKGALIIYSIAGTGATNADILKELAPRAGETILGAIGPDKFIGSDLEKGQSHQDGGRDGHAGADLGAAHRRRGHAARVQGDRANRRHVVGRHLPRALHRLASRHGRAHQQRNDADQIRSDRFLRYRPSQLIT